MQIKKSSLDALFPSMIFVHSDCDRYKGAGVTEKRRCVSVKLRGTIQNKNVTPCNTKRSRTTAVAVAAAAEKKEEELNAGVASSGRPPLGVQAVIWLVGAFGLPRLDRWGRHRWISAGIFKNPLEIQKNPPERKYLRRIECESWYCHLAKVWLEIKEKICLKNPGTSNKTITLSCAKVSLKPSRFF